LIRLQPPPLHQPEDPIPPPLRLGSVHLASLLQGLDNAPGGQEIVRLPERVNDFETLPVRI